MEPTEEKVRYYLVFATNSLHGIEVFKKAEMEAAEAQDEVRHEKRIEKTSQTTFLFDNTTPQSPKMSYLKQHHMSRARAKVIELLGNGNRTVFSYEEIYAKAMAFPLVTPRDLQNWITTLEVKTALKIHWEGTNRKTLSWSKKDSVLVTNKLLLQ